jgi:LPS sulfotransferase NodH
LSDTEIAPLTPESCYFICTLPRSGSWLLAEALEKTRVAGRPREYFEPKLFEGKPAAVPAALDRIFRKGMTKNSVFGAKLHWYQFEFAVQLVLSDHAPHQLAPIALAKNFPKLKYIWLTRREKVRQAISYYRATKTGQWWNIPEVTRHANDIQQPDFDFERIQYLEGLLVRHETNWHKFFDENEIDPLVLVYEDFAQTLESAVDEVLSYVGLSRPKEVDLSSRLLRQSDLLTETWVEMYTHLKRNRRSTLLRLPGQPSREMFA